MKARIVIVASLTMLAVVAGAQTKSGSKVPDVLNFTMNRITGQPVNLSNYAGKSCLS
jgi:hypothetical protein